MSYSFTKIERTKSRAIRYAFACLVAFYFVSFWLISLLVLNPDFFLIFLASDGSGGVSGGVSGPSLLGTLSILITALATAGFHWFMTVKQMRRRIAEVLGGRPPNPQDPDEKQLNNILAEISAATGGKLFDGIIIPSMAINACAFDDGQSTPVIALTEGLLYRMSREQIESIVAHEAAYIISGDCRSTTIISSMFEIYAGMLEISLILLTGRNESGLSYRSNSRYSSRVSARFLPMILAIIVLLMVINVLAHLMKMFISRQRVLRADAVTVRLTRNPVALAEALHITTQKRISMSEAANQLGSLFIVHPRGRTIDESASKFADVMSSHPPVAIRVDILLQMARATEDDLRGAAEESLKRYKRKTPQLKVSPEDSGTQMWQALDASGQWQGPFLFDEMMNTEWITTETQVKKVGALFPVPLIQIHRYQILTGDRPEPEEECEKTCPGCGAMLKKSTYEREDVLSCDHCGGFLVSENGAGVIIQRKMETFSERIRKQAEILARENAIPENQMIPYRKSDRPYRCQNCRMNPSRWLCRPFNRYYPVEIDKCSECGLIWFDKDELEMLQYLVEKANKR